MSRRVPGRRYDPDPLRDVRLTSVELVAGIGEVVQADDRIVLLPMGGIELDLLREDRGIGEPRVPTAVVEVEVAVHHHADVVRRHAGGCEGIVQ
jgi:hypothetical protein